jgi:protocatechuate 3,4-dioxygenase beta subunit
MLPVLAKAQTITPKTIDPDFVRMWDGVQVDRPGAIGNRASLVGVGEPGTPLVVRGRIFAANGTSPLAGAVVFAYQTDKTGVYDRPGRRGWRLKAWARADADGRFVLDSVHPGPYPGRSVASHIHLGLDGPVGQRQTLEDVLFEGDPLLSDEQKQRAKAAGRFGNIVPVTTRQNREECEIMLRLTGEYVF